MALIERQVCRVELDGNAAGTGFLVGPDSVITNYHVVGAVLKGTTPASAVTCRFDYKVLSNGARQEGVVVKLHATDWNVDFSPPSAAEKTQIPDVPPPTLEELDYALIRLERRLGEGPSAPKGGEGGPSRGWLVLPSETPVFLPKAPLMIAQHPDGKPLKLAIDTESVIGVNANRTRVRYATNTEAGSSGSPVFDLDWNLVALHHLGDPAYDHPAAYNQGVPIDKIRTRLTKTGARRCCPGRHVRSLRIVGWRRSGGETMNLNGQQIGEFTAILRASFSRSDFTILLRTELDLVLDDLVPEDDGWKTAAYKLIEIVNQEGRIIKLIRAGPEMRGPTTQCSLPSAIHCSPEKNGAEGPTPGDAQLRTAAKAYNRGFNDRYVLFNYITAYKALHDVLHELQSFLPKIEASVAERKADPTRPLEDDVVSFLEDNKRIACESVTEIEFPDKPPSWIGRLVTAANIIIGPDVEKMFLARGRASESTPFRGDWARSTTSYLKTPAASSPPS